MREGAQKGEVATLIYENTDKARRHIKDVHNYLRSAKASKEILAAFPDWARFYPLERIAETAFFVDKTESSILQVADAIAFTLNRQLRGAPNNQRFYEPFRDNLMTLPRASSSLATV